MQVAARQDELSEQFWKAFQAHREHPEISSRAYRARRRLTLGKSVAKKIRIYLDTRYWIHVRDARQGKPEKPEHEQIYKLLHQLVLDGKVLCPASFPAFDELLKHKDKQVRLASAETLDELSNQVCLINHIELTRAEIMGLFRRFTPNYPLPAPMLECVWTKAGFFSGEMVPTNKTIPPDFERAFQKAFEDQWARLEFSYIVEGYFKSNREENSEDFVRQLNDSISKFSATAKSQRQLYKAQFLSLFQEHNDLIADVMRQLCKDIFGKTFEQCTDFLEPLFEQVLQRAFSLKETAFDLPGIHIWSSLLSAIAWDKRHPFTAHDIHDVMHAHSALPYYNYVFVERRFSHLMTTPPNKLAETYGAKVCWKEADVIKELELLNRKLN
ncbi:MAG TPA: hypothetical protein VFV23_13290 [Verrucomicrobiae bacterium]|nr:hypothetical protein [Verrucomicrobiae bacterium]